jgi:hypothetical protein
MPTITASLLNDTLNVISLARETALARGGKEQADRLTPVVDGLRSVATAARQSQPAARSAAAASPQTAATGSRVAVQPTGTLAQDDFKSLLAAVQKAPLASTPSAPAQDRGQVAAAMAAGGMGEVDIARQLGISREEVRLMLSTYGNGNSGGGSANRLSAAGLKAYWR